MNNSSCLVWFWLELCFSSETFAVLTSGSITWGSSTIANHFTRNKVIVAMKQIMLFTILPSVVPDIRRVIISPIPNSIYYKVSLGYGNSARLLKETAQMLLVWPRPLSERWINYSQTAQCIDTLTLYSLTTTILNSCVLVGGWKSHVFTIQIRETTTATISLITFVVVGGKGRASCYRTK